MRRLTWLYSQQDPAWGALPLGQGCDAGVTLAADGCDLTTAAMVLSDFGYTINPADLNALLINEGGFVNGCELSDDQLTKIHATPGDLKVTCQVFHFEDRPADLSLLVPLDDNTQVTVEITAPGVPSHRMRVADAWTSAGDPQNTVLVDDPWQSPGYTRRLWNASLGASEPDVAKAIQKIIWYTAGGTV